MYQVVASWSVIRVPCYMRRGLPVRVLARFETLKAGILCLVPEVVPPAPNNISALKVPASDFISRDVYCVPDLTSVLMPGFIAGLDFNQIRWNHRLCYPQTTISALRHISEISCILTAEGSARPFGGAYCNGAFFYGCLTVVPSFNCLRPPWHQRSTSVARGCSPRVVVQEYRQGPDLSSWILLGRWLCGISAVIVPLARGWGSLVCKLLPFFVAGFSTWLPSATCEQIRGIDGPFRSDQ